MNLSQESIASLRKLLTSGDIRPGDILDSLAENIAAKNPSIGAYLSHDLEAAKKEADTADLSLPLGGIPIAIKDNINVKGQPCSCASRFLDGAYTAPYDATVTAKLRAAGAIPFGRANMDEFAMGSTTENSALAKTVNPHDPARVPGGSSGGSAAAAPSASQPATVAWSGSNPHTDGFRATGWSPLPRRSIRSGRSPAPSKTLRSCSMPFLALTRPTPPLWITLCRTSPRGWTMEWLA